MSAWFNYIAASKILFFGLLVGAALPALFAIGVRLNAENADTEGVVTQRKPLFVVLSWTIFAVVVVAAILGVLFIARDFIGHHTGWYSLGAQQ